MTYNLGFIGGGNMSTAILEGIVKQNAHPVSKIWVSGPRINNLKRWTELGTNVTTKNGEVYSKCNIVFLGVKPSMLSTAIADCLSTIPPDMSCKDVLFVSMLAGITIGTLRKELQALSSKIRIIRIMPNTPMMVGAGACIYSPDVNVDDRDCQILESLLRTTGICERVPESMMDTLGSMSGCGPAFIYIIIEALADGAVKQGVPRATALRFAAQTVMGSGRMVLDTGKHPGQLKDEVCSPGGSTICGVAALEDGKIRSSLINAVQASALRSKELGKK